MKILVINSGSSSIKYQLIKAPEGKVFAKGLVERIGIDNSRLKHKNLVEGTEKIVEEAIPDHTKGLKMVIEIMLDKEHGVLERLEEIAAIGHRVVHGGVTYSDSVIIDDDVKDHVTKCIPMAPLHNPANLLGIDAAETIHPQAPNVAVFDTAFHQTMPEASYVYAIPYDLYKQKNIRRYGFHGISHKYVAQRAAEILGKKLEEVKLLSLHLGNGASITAVDKGKSIDTSLGFGTMCGLVMGTRAGDVDPAVVMHLVEHENYTQEQVKNLLYKESGVYGLSGLSSDMRDVEDEAEAGHARCQLALDVYVHHLKKFIGAYTAEMNGLDGIIFTAGVGENSPYVREKTLTDMEYLGIKFDASKNDFKGREEIISTEDSPVTCMVIPTNEELMIALDTYKLVSRA